MKTSHLYTADFPEEHKVQSVDIVTLYHEGRFDELDAVVVCKDKNGCVTATFGQSNWNCFPFSRKKISNTLNFSNFDSVPKLQRELKIFTFGWLFNTSPQGKKALSFAGTHSRLRSIKKIYLFLMQQSEASITALSSMKFRLNLENNLREQGYTLSTLEKTFGAINGIISDANWHNIQLGLDPIKATKNPKSLMVRNNNKPWSFPSGYVMPFTARRWR